MIYVSAIYADEGHTMVTGTDANGASETVPSDHTVFRCPDDGPVGFVNNGGTIAPYQAPQPPDTQTCPTCGGSGQVPA